MGWTYDELLALPLEVYEVLIDHVREEHERERRARDTEAA